MTLSHVNMTLPVTKVWFKTRTDDMCLVATLPNWQSHLLSPRDLGLTTRYWVSPLRHTVAVHEQGHVQHVHDHWDKAGSEHRLLDRRWQGRVHFVECQYDLPSPSLPSPSPTSTSDESSPPSTTRPSASSTRLGAVSDSNKDCGGRASGVSAANSSSVSGRATVEERATQLLNEGN